MQSRSIQDLDSIVASYTCLNLFRLFVLLFMYLFIWGGSGGEDLPRDSDTEPIALRENMTYAFHKPLKSKIFAISRQQTTDILPIQLLANNANVD